MHLMKVPSQKQSPVVRNLSELTGISFDDNKPTVERTHVLTKEVMKACNLIRPNVVDLT